MSLVITVFILTDIVITSSTFFDLFLHLNKITGRNIISCFNSHNLIVRNISMAAKISSFSEFGDNCKYFSYKYGIGIHV